MNSLPKNKTRGKLVFTFLLKRKKKKLYSFIYSLNKNGLNFKFQMRSATLFYSRGDLDEKVYLLQSLITILKFLMVNESS